MDNCSRLPQPEPLPPCLGPGGLYVRRAPAWPAAFPDPSDTEHYAEGVGTSSPRGPFIVPSAPAHILLEASKDPSFPRITVSVSAHCGTPNIPCKMVMDRAKGDMGLWVLPGLP